MLGKSQEKKTKSGSGTSGKVFFFGVAREKKQEKGKKKKFQIRTKNRPFFCWGGDPPETGKSFWVGLNRKLGVGGCKPITWEKKNRNKPLVMKGKTVPEVKNPEKNFQFKKEGFFVANLLKCPCLKKPPNGKKVKVSPP